MRPVVLLAGGENKRLDLDFPKLILPLNGETLMGRTLRLLKERCEVEQIAVSARQNLAHHCDHWTGLRVTPGATKGESIVAACKAMDAIECTVLFGDVVYDEDELKEIVNFVFLNFVFAHEKNRFTGKNYQECIGATIGPETLKAIAASTDDPRHPLSKPPLTALRQLPAYGCEFKLLHGWSDDIDTPTDMIRLPLLTELARVQDRR